MKNKIERKTRIMPLIGIFSGFFLLALVTTYFYSPVKKSFADSRNASYTFNVDIVPAISLSSVNNVVFSFNNISEGAFQSKSASVKVTANIPLSYDLYFSTVDRETNLVASNTSSVISSSFTDGATSSTMPYNSWGVSIDNETFNKVRGFDQAVLVKTMDVANFSPEWIQTLYFGVKVGSTLPRGYYVKDVVFTAVAGSEAFDFDDESGESGGESGGGSDPEEQVEHHNRLIEATNMQDPNLAQYCADTYTPTSSSYFATFDATFYDDSTPRAVLTDTRDGNKYLISKLHDGNCWMSQNLDLTLKSDEPLTNDKTDLNTKASWVPENDTQTTVPLIRTFVYEESTESNGRAYFWPRTETTARSYRRIKDLYVVRGVMVSEKPTEYTDEFLWEKVGVSYNWYAATAGTTYGNQATDSICPKGWKLPTREEYAVTFPGKTASTTYAYDERANLVPYNEIGASGYGQALRGYDDDSYYNRYYSSYGSGYWMSTPGYMISEQIYPSGGDLPVVRRELTGYTNDATAAYDGYTPAVQAGWSIRCKLR